MRDELRSRSHKLVPLKLGELSAHKAAQPATCGVAMLVPLIVRYLVGRIQDEKMSRPGPAMSIFPWLEKLDGARFESSDATDMIVGEFAGAPAGELAFPDAAIMSSPLLRAACPAAV